MRRDRTAVSGNCLASYLVRSVWLSGSTQVAIIAATRCSGPALSTSDMAMQRQQPHHLLSVSGSPARLVLGEEIIQRVGLVVELAEVLQIGRASCRERV